MSTAWSFLTLDEGQRQFAGNTGYADDLGSHYVWDETVKNRERVRIGDLAVLRDRTFVLGVGWIDEIQTWRGDKQRFRCPLCSKTGFKERKLLQPRYRCPDCGGLFDERIMEELRNIVFFRADYARTWRALDVPLRVDEIDALYLKNAKQHAIRELQLDEVTRLFRQRESVQLPTLVLGSRTEVVLPGGHRAFLGKARVGQQRFREEMLDRFGACCAISGPTPTAALEAAHLYRYADIAEHRLDGGLLLRRDLHALFDRGLVYIDCEGTWSARVAPQLLAYPEFARFHGAPLHLDPRLRPSEALVREHAAIARAGW